MPKGGARNKSGPPADPNSGRSEQRGFKLTALPASYSGPVPRFPLPKPTRRESDLWRAKWSGPHGAAWSQPSEKWRHHTIALWVRTFVRCEAPDAPATLIGQLHRLADQIGLTDAGLAAMGWAIAEDEVGAKRATKTAAAVPAKAAAPRRLRNNATAKK